MITIEQLNNVIEKEFDWDDSFIKNHSYMYYSDILESHRHIINKLKLSFWIAELFESYDSSTTLIYTWVYNNNIIVLQEWLPEFNSLEEYLKWLNEMEEQALVYNK